MTQLHKQFTVEQIIVLFVSYELGHLSRSEIENTLGISKTRFFALLKQYRNDPDAFTIDYHRTNQSRLGELVEGKIRHELLRDKELIDNKDHSYEQWKGTPD